MADISSSATIKEQSPNAGTKVIAVDLPSTAVTADTVALTLSSYGASSVRGIVGFDSDNNVQEQPTWAVSTGVLTITLGGTANTAARSYVIYLA